MTAVGPRPNARATSTATGLLLLLVTASLLAGCAGSTSRDPAHAALPPGKGAVLANVLREGDQARLEGVQVVVQGGGYGVSDANGHVVIGPMAPGHYKAISSKAGYEGAPVEFEVKADEYTEIPIFMSATSNTR